MRILFVLFYWSIAVPIGIISVMTIGMLGWILRTIIYKLIHFSDKLCCWLMELCDKGIDGILKIMTPLIKKNFDKNV